MRCLYVAVLLVCFVGLFENSMGCDCPPGTAIRVIEKNTDSDDKKKLTVETTCKDDKGKVLHKCNETQDNPFGPDVQVHSFQYKGFITNHQTIDHSPEPKENNGIETLD